MGVDEIFTVLQDLGFSKYSKGDATAMVAAVDADGNGTIDLDEFIALLRSKKTGKYAKMTFEQELKAAFDIFDADEAHQPEHRQQLEIERYDTPYTLPSLPIY